MSSSTELPPWHRVGSFLLAVAWQFRSTNISSSSIVNSAHVVEAEFAASKILLIFWVAQGPAEPPFMYERTNKMLLHCKHLNSELGAQTALHLSVSKGVIQRKKESQSSATNSANDNSRPGPMAQAVHTGMKYVLFT